MDSLSQVSTVRRRWFIVASKYSTSSVSIT